MKRQLFYTSVILATLNGIQAFNFGDAFEHAAHAAAETAANVANVAAENVANVAVGKVSCTANLVKAVEGSLPNPNPSHIQQIKKCVSSNPQDMASHNPNFTKALYGICKNNEQFRHGLKPQCKAAMQAVRFIERDGNQAKGMAPHRNKSKSHRQSHGGNRGNAKHRNQMQHHPNQMQHHSSQGNYAKEQGCHCDCPHHNNLQGNGHSGFALPDHHAPAGNYGPTGQYHDPQGYGQPFHQMDPNQQGYYQPQQPMPQQMQIPQQWPQQQLPQHPQCAYPQQAQGYPPYGYQGVQ